MTSPSIIYDNSRKLPTQGMLILDTNGTISLNHNSKFIVEMQLFLEPVIELMKNKQSLGFYNNPPHYKVHNFDTLNMRIKRGQFSIYNHKLYRWTRVGDASIYFEMINDSRHLDQVRRRLF